MNFLELIFIFPLRYLMNLVFEGSIAFTGNIGVSILILSIVVNTSLLPLYYLAERWQNREREIQKSMAPGLLAIKGQYQGEERYKRTAELYRTFNYHPVYSLRTSFGFLIQVPFFIAAYTLLSANPRLLGVQFLFLDNLGVADGIVAIGTWTLNLMPLLMTAFNLLASYVYARDFTLREKVKLVLIAIVFLILLYNSASGLVLYWTLNNIYSLAKNLIHHPVRIREGAQPCRP